MSHDKHEPCALCGHLTLTADLAGAPVHGGGVCEACRVAEFELHSAPVLVAAHCWECDKPLGTLAEVGSNEHLNTLCDSCQDQHIDDIRANTRRCETIYL